MNYPGGKGGCFRQIVNLMPVHEVYIETHLGGGNVLERKLPAQRNIGIDLDPVVITTWRAAAGRLGFDLELHHGDALAFLEDYPFTGRELVYSDPPYLHETRGRSDIYRFEYTRDHHIALLDRLLSLPCPVMVSGYRSDLYVDTLERGAGWRRIDFRSATRGGPRIESVWCNFPESAELHDSRYVGRDYRERERIRRKAARWRRMLMAMPAAERQAVLDAISGILPPAAAVQASKRSPTTEQPCLNT